MDSDQKFWVCIWIIVLCIVATFFGWLYLGNQQDNDAIVDLVRAGASPIEAACAIRPGSLNAALCPR